jgi:hypothetical protein
MEDRDESPVQATLTGVTTWLKDARKFWGTRRAVLRNRSLWDYKAEELLSAGYLGPWKFNLFQTAAAGGLAAVVGKLLDLVSPAPEAIHTPLLGDPELDRLFFAAMDWLEPFTIPTLLTAFVFLMGWGSLKAKDSTPQRRKRARAAYLYLDAAYGFWSQLFLALFVTVASSNLSLRKLGDAPWLVALFVCLSFWQLYITGGKIPKFLFQANGYSNRAGHFWQRRRPDDPPWNRLLLANLISSIPIYVGLQLSVVLLSRGYAYGVQALRHLVR